MYTFIKRTRDDHSESDKIFAVSPERIQEMRMSETYGRYGQPVSRDEAGDSITLITQKAVDIANKAYIDYHNDNEDGVLTPKWEIRDCISAYDYSLEGFDAVVDASDLEEDIDYEYHALTVKGFNYWDGNNWASIIVESYDYDTDFEVITDQDLIEELNRSIEEKEFESESFGMKHYRGGDYQITDNYCQGAWATWEITCVDNLQLEQS